MKSGTYPLAMPDELLDEVRKTAKATGLSMADAMRQSMKLGLPKLREQLSTGKVKPFTTKEIAAAFKRDREWEAFESAMTNTPVPLPEGQYHGAVAFEPLLIAPSETQPSLAPGLS